MQAIPQPSARRSAAVLRAAVVLASTALCCASAPRVHLDDTADFSQYRTWGWQSSGARPGRSASALDIAVATQIQRSLLGRGLHYVAQEPDLRVSARLLVTQEQVTRYTTPALDWISTMHSDGSYNIQTTMTEIQYHQRGRLSLAVRDATRHRELFSGHIERRYPDGMGSHLAEVVGSLVERLPLAAGKPAEPSPQGEVVEMAADHAAGLSSFSPL